MPLFLGLTAAALFVSLHAAPAAVTRAPSPEPAARDELNARVEIGPSVLTIYGPDGKVVSVQ